jgi:hypothetical protein
MGFEANFSDDPDPRSHSSASLEGNIRLGLDALRLAKDLRYAYDWEVPAELHRPNDWMLRELAAIERQHEARRAADARTFEGLETLRKERAVRETMPSPIEHPLQRGRRQALAKDD